MRTERIRLLIVTHDLLGDPFWAILLQGVVEGARVAGCDTDHHRPDVFTPARMRAAVERALAQHPDGLLTTLPDPEALDRTLRTAIDDGLPVIILNTFDRRPAAARLAALCSIAADDVEGGRRAAEKILECGPSRGALCVDHYQKRNTCHEQRAAGFTQRMSEARALVDHLAVDGSDPGLAARVVAQRLERTDRPIDAVLSLGPPGWALVDAAAVATGLDGPDPPCEFRRHRPCARRHWRRPHPCHDRLSAISAGLLRSRADDCISPAWREPLRGDHDGAASCRHRHSASGEGSLRRRHRPWEDRA